ncbi:2-hydroxy-palmitic acid dioxygenase mpo1, partial [Pseudolycoriella hygida]
MALTDLEEQFTFYAAYHHTTVNKIIHVICVWPILWSALVLSEYIPLVAPEQFNTFVVAVHPLNVTFVAAVFYAAVYLLMDKKAGFIATLLLAFCLVSGRKFYLEAELNYGYAAWQIAAVIQVVCWVAQFVGHGVFEGRAPALFDNLVQAVVMAPLFVLLEVLFLLGYRKDFQKTIWKKVEKEIAKFKNQSNKTKSSVKSNKSLNDDSNNNGMPLISYQHPVMAQFCDQVLPQAVHSSSAIRGECVYEMYQIV